MDRSRTYSLDELQGFASMFSDMLKYPPVLLGQAADMKKNHPWTTTFVEALEDAKQYADLVKQGGGRAKLTELTIEIDIPSGCVTDGSWELWGDDLPLEFHFEKVEGGFRFVKSMSNRERAEARCCNN